MKNTDSRFLSYVLRHKPKAIGLKLDEHGWASVESLLDCVNSHGRKLNLSSLKEIVRTNNKKRFSFSDDGLMIRANQGHSIDIDLGLESKTPPEFLYHGTAVKFIPSIKKSNGLLSMNRNHVHLSHEIETAKQVGTRHGKALVMTIKAGEMNNNGYKFFLSDNNVWLTNHVPLVYIKEY